MTQVVLAVALGALASIGSYLLLRRDVVRVVWGVAILGQTANVYLVTMGGLTGTAPILEHGGEHAGVTDPLVQALVLTAIVIGFGTTAFALVLTYRLYQEHGTMDLREVAGDLAEVHRAVLLVEPVGQHQGERGGAEPDDDGREHQCLDQRVGHARVLAAVFQDRGGPGESAHRDEVDVRGLAEDGDAPDDADDVPPEQEVAADRRQGTEGDREDHLGHSRPTTLTIVRSAPTTTR